MRRAVIIGIHFLAGLSRQSFADESGAVVILKSSQAKPYTAASKGFREIMTKKHKDVRVYEYTLREDIFTEINDKAPSVILTVGTDATRLAYAQKMEGAPLIYSMVLNPEEVSFVTRGIPGVSLDISADKVLDTIEKIAPGVRRIGIIHKFDEGEKFIKSSLKEAGKRKIELISIPINSQNALEDALRELSTRADALWMIPGSLYTPNAVREVLLYALREGIPVIGLSPRYVKAGALFSLSCDYEDIGRQTGKAVAEMLSGRELEKPPIPPRKVILSVNLIVAKRLKLNIPPEIINSAKNTYR